MCIIEIFEYLHEKTNADTYSPKMIGYNPYRREKGLASHPQVCLQEYYNFCKALKFISEKEEGDWTTVTYLGIPVLSVKLNSGKDFINVNIYVEGKRVTDECVPVNANGNEGFVLAHCSAISYFRESNNLIMYFKCLLKYCFGYIRYYIENNEKPVTLTCRMN